MEERFAPTHDAGGEAELADDTLQVLGAERGRGEDAANVGQEVEAAVGRDGDGLGDGVDHEAKVVEGPGGPLLLLVVAA